MGEGVEHIEREIANLRAIITELRPAALDELGLRTAIEALHRPPPRTAHGTRSTVSCNYRDQPRGETRFSDELETTVYRLVQEALTNIAKHAGASTIDVSVARIRR